MNGQQEESSHFIKIVFCIFDSFFAFSSQGTSIGRRVTAFSV